MNLIKFLSRDLKSNTQKIIEIYTFSINFLRYDFEVYLLVETFVDFIYRIHRPDLFSAAFSTIEIPTSKFDVILSLFYKNV